LERQTARFEANVHEPRAREIGVGKNEFHQTRPVGKPTQAKREAAMIGCYR
jgi:hypothetical protein